MSPSAARRDALDRLLRPRSIAIVGIGPEPTSLGGICNANLERFGYRGEIHFVSRSHTDVGGKPCVSTIDALPEDIDTAILALPRAAIVDAIAACARRHIGAAVVFASGFAELDETGRLEQERLAAFARDAGMAIVGPNCLGLVNYVDGIPYMMGPTQREAQTKRARVAVLAQSGGMMATIRGALLSRGIGVSFAISTGNEAVTTVEDFLGAVLEAGEPGPIAMFVECLRQPRHFLKLAGKARELGKPLLLLHTGRSERSRDAARSHTGAIAGDYDVMRTFVEHAGVQMFETLGELIDAAALLARFPNAVAGNLGAFTDSGAYKGLMIDVCDDLDLPFARLEDRTVTSIEAAMPEFAQVSNPLDLTAHVMRDGNLYAAAADAFTSDDRVAAVVGALMTGAQSLKTFAESSALATLMASKKPSAIAFIGTGQLPAAVVDAAKADGYPLFGSGEAALHAIARVMSYAARSSQPRGGASEIADPSLPQISVGDSVTEYQAKTILAAAGIPVPAGAFARTPDDAVAIADRIGYPVVLKGQASALMHKSDAGGVVVDIRDEERLRVSWSRIVEAIGTARPTVVLEGMLVERMAPAGVEIVVGAKRDLDWGTVLIAGVGGIWIEALNDVVTLPDGATREEIASGLRALKASALLTGSRGASAVDIDAIAGTLVRLGTIMRAVPNIGEIEINPLAAYADGVLALDALIVSG